MSALRRTLAAVLWLVAVAAALVLGAATLALALNADQGPAWVDDLVAAADRLGLGVFTLEDGVWESTGRGPEVKNALSNWGAAAAAWLLAGWTLAWLVRPTGVGSTTGVAK